MAQSFGIVNSESLPAWKMGRFPSLMTHVSIRYIYIYPYKNRRTGAFVSKEHNQPASTAPGLLVLLLFCDVLLCSDVI
jgi:hypothetical protein